MVRADLHLKFERFNELEEALKSVYATLRMILEPEENIVRGIRDNDFVENELRKIIDEML